MAVAFEREHASLAQSGNGLAATQTVTLTAPAKPNSRMVLLIATDGRTVTGVTDTAGHSYARDAQFTGSLGNEEIWSAHLTSGLDPGQVISITFSADADFSLILVSPLEFSGISQTAYLGGYATGKGSTAALTSGYVNASVADGAIVGFGAYLLATNLAPGAGLTAGTRIEAAQSGGISSESLHSLRRIVAATGYYLVDGTLTGAAAWDALAVAYLASGGSGAGGGGSAPVAPSGLAATAISAGSIDLAWTDNSGNESGFRIERSLDGSTWTEIAVTAAGVVSYSNTGLSAATLYYYRVRGYNSAGNSAYTSTASATTLGTTAGGGGAGGSGAGSSACDDPLYATAADVQGRVWMSNLVINQTSEPSIGEIETWLMSASRWIDSTLSFRYVVPVTDACDLEILRPICAALVAAQVWRGLASRNPGQEGRAPELEEEAFLRLGLERGSSRNFIAGVGAFPSGGSGRFAARAWLVLPNTPEAEGTGPSRGDTPVSTFADPDADDETPRRFRLDKEL